MPFAVLLFHSSHLEADSFLLQLNPVGLCVLIWPTRSDGAWLTDLALKGPQSFCLCPLGCQVPSQEVRVRRLTDVKSCGREIRGSANNQHQGTQDVSEAMVDLTVLIKPMTVINLYLCYPVWESLATCLYCVLGMGLGHLKSFILNFTWF